MDESQFDGLGSLVRLSGVNVPSRARFVGETMVYSTLSSITFGMVCGQVGAIALTTGPLVPFLCGSWIGYSIGLCGHWMAAKREALFFAERYPRILAHALWTERSILVPPSIIKATEEKQLEQQQEEEKIVYGKEYNETMTMDQWVRSGGMGRMSWAVLAAQSCKADVEEVQRQQRQRLMDEHTEKFE